MPHDAVRGGAVGLYVGGGYFATFLLKLNVYNVYEFAPITLARNAE